MSFFFKWIYVSSDTWSVENFSANAIFLHDFYMFSYDEKQHPYVQHFTQKITLFTVIIRLSLASVCFLSIDRFFLKIVNLKFFILFSFKNLYKSKITTYKRPLAFSFMKDSELRIMQCNSFFIGLSLINEHHCIVLNSGSIGHKTARSCIWNPESTTRMHIQFIKY